MCGVRDREKAIDTETEKVRRRERERESRETETERERQKRGRYIKTEMESSDTNLPATQCTRNTFAT